MSERRPPRDIWKQPPEKPRPVEEELADSPALAGPEPAPQEEPEPKPEEPQEEPGYAPRHRAPGRAPLIRRRRNRPEDTDDVEVKWETTWREKDDDADRSWIAKEESIVAPPPKPVEEVPYLGPRRSERRRRPAPAEEEGPPELIRRARDYTGRHLAPKKPSPWSRGAEGDVEEFADRSEIDHLEPRRAPSRREEKTLVEGDVGDEPVSGLFARPWRSRKATPPVEDKQPDGPGDEPQEIEIDIAGVEAAAETVAEADVAAPEAAPEPEPEATMELAPQPEPEAAPEPEPPPEPEGVEPEPERELEPQAVRPEPEPVEPSAPSAPPVAAVLQEPVETGSSDELYFEGDEDVSETEPSDEDEDEDEEVVLGPRTAALQERKKKKKVRQTAGGVLAGVLALGAIAGVGLLAKRVVEQPKERVAVPLPEAVPETEGGSTLFFGTREDAGTDRGAIWMTLFHYDAEQEKASIVYIPPHTAVEVPGRGLQGVGEAYGSGGIPLLLVATENLLGVSVDRYVELSDSDARVFFESIGSVTVDVPSEVRVPVGKDQARLIFVDGPQELTPDLLVKLLYIVGIDGDDVELGSRHLAFWDALFDQYENPEDIADLFEAAGPALGESDASAEDHGTFFASIADLEPEKLTITALPVRPISAGDSELYATDEVELAEFVASTIVDG